MRAFYLKIIVIHVCFLSYSSVMCQTSSEDVDFFKSDLIIENYGDYETENIGVWGLDDGNVKRSVKFVQVSHSNQKKGVGIIYLELIQGSVQTQKAYFIPEKESDAIIWDEALKLISTIDDQEELRTLFWALMQYSSNK